MKIKALGLGAIVCSCMISVSAQELLYRQSFEEPISNFPEIQWTTSGYSVTQAVVEHMPQHGLKSVRGNFNKDVVDPITNIAGNPFTQLKINFKRIPRVKDWYASTNTIYVSWWFKLDRCDWRGPALNKSDPIALSGKFAYLRMNENPATSYYMVMRGGASGEGVLSTNGWNSLFENWYDRPSLYLNTFSSYGADGKWHQISIYIKKDGNERRLAWWIDGKIMKASRFESNSGHHKINKDFIMDSIQFWHAADSEMNESRNVANDGKNFCNGWQIDDFQIWSDHPSKPLPPLTN